MRIAQLTDSHVMAKGELLHGTIDSGCRLKETIAFVNDMEPAVDAILLTGDLVEKPSEAAYAMLADILGTARAPLYVIPGNHDERQALARALAGTPYYPVTDGFSQFAIETFPVRLVCLDSVLAGGELPEFDAERARWLEVVLAAELRKPTLVAIHHPPFRTGVAFVDLAEPDWTVPLARILKKNPQVKLVVAGHAHISLWGELAGVPAYVAPSTAFQLVSRLGADEASLRLDAAGPVTLHYWNGNSFSTTQYPMEKIDESERLDRLAGTSWDSMKAAMKRGIPR